MVKRWSKSQRRHTGVVSLLFCTRPACLPYPSFRSRPVRRMYIWSSEQFLGWGNFLLRVGF